MDNKLFWTLSPKGEEVLRNLEEENKEFSTDDYFNGKFDANNYQWYEMFNHYVYDDLGCDYERYGCYIQEGDVVLDLGGNIGVFAHRAENRGASKVISFEPITPTFNCLIKNAGPKTTVYKNAVGNQNKFVEFQIHTDFTHIGGGASQTNDEWVDNRNIIHTEKVYVININEIFESLVDKIDFLKMDIEGGEIDVLTEIKDIHLQSLRCLAAEFHKTNNDFDGFQSNFINRMDSLGFNHFTVYHGNGDLRTLNFWKR